MSLPQWKAYFSMFVLEQTNPLYNPTCNNIDPWYRHQSCPWLTIVKNFELKSTYFWRGRFTVVLRELEYPNHCYSCGYPSKEYYCDYCEENQCSVCYKPGSDCYCKDECRYCGEEGCGGYCESYKCNYCGEPNAGGTWCSKTCRRLSNQVF